MLFCVDPKMKGCCHLHPSPILSCCTLKELWNQVGYNGEGLGSHLGPEPSAQFQQAGLVMDDIQPAGHAFSLYPAGLTAG